MSTKYAFPYEIRELTNDENEILTSSFGTKMGFVKFIGNRACIPAGFRELRDTFYNFKPRSDDIWLIGYPRSGTTLTQEILYLLGTDMNYEKAAAEIMDYRFPVLHFALYRNENDAEVLMNSPLKDKLIAPPHEYLEESREKRFIKSHFGFSFIHPEILDIGCKVVFIVRNPKDALNSYAHFPAVAKDPGYSFEKVWKLFKYDLHPSGNYFEMLQEAWERRHNKNLLILFYEEVNADKKAAVLKIAEFLGKQLTVDQLEKLLEHLKIDNFKNNKSLNNDHLVDCGIFEKNDKFSFIRKGKNGGWREGIPQKFIADVDEWAKENLAKIPNFKVPELWKIVMDWN